MPPSPSSERKEKGTDASRPDFLIRPTRAAEAPPVAVFMDGFQYHRESTDQDSAKRMALVRAGFLVWSLTWHDLEAAFGRQAQAVDFFGDEAAGVAPTTASKSRDLEELQRRLDDGWDTTEIRRRLHESSLELLVHYLAEPAPEKWKRAVFTALLGRFDQSRMLTREMRSGFDQAAAQALPEQVREALNELGRGDSGDNPESRVARGGSGVWLDKAPAFADLFVAVSAEAIRRREPDDMFAVVHLHDDETSRESPDYRPVWNGVLRLFNLLQFLPNAWWTTRLGVTRHVYPEYVRVDSAPPGDAPREEWKEALALVAPELRPAMEHWSGLDLPAPEVGFELTGPEGRVIAEAELAWSDLKVAVLLAEQRVWAALFEEAGWTVFDGTAENLTESVAAILVA